MPPARSRKHKQTTNAPGLTGDASESSQIIPEDEQWRLIEQSGVLRKFQKPQEPERQEEEDNEVCSPLMEEVFNSILLIIPFTSLLVMMDILQLSTLAAASLAHRQYAQSMTNLELMKSVLTNLPILSLFIFYTTRYKADLRMQALLFLLSVVSGTRIIYIVNTANWLIVIRQGPPLGTIWVYTIAQLNLLPAIVALGVVAGWVKLYGMKIVF